MRLCKLPGFLLISVFLGYIFCFMARAEKISLLGTDLFMWKSIDARAMGRESKGTVAYVDGVFKFGNTRGLWPGMEYEFPSKITFNIEKDRIGYDFTPGISTNIILFFQDGNGENQFVYLNPGIPGVILDNINSEIQPTSYPYKGEMSLGHLNTGPYNGKTFSGEPVSFFANQNGDIFLTAVRIEIIGTTGKTVDFKTLEVRTPDNTTAKPTSTTKASKTTRSRIKSNTTNSKTSGASKSGMDTTGKLTNEMPVSQKDSKNSGGQPSDGLVSRVDSEKTGGVTQNSSPVEASCSSADTENSNTETIPAGEREFDSVSFNISKLAIPVVCGIFLVLTLVYFRKFPQNNSNNDE